uniref:Uncharacterized protein n=1 Tax=Rhizophora mucronata TaxID=61149 RepID=A0A2P2PTD4_RHIMU
MIDFIDICQLCKNRINDFLNESLGSTSIYTWHSVGLVILHLEYTLGISQSLQHASTGRLEICVNVGELS